MRVKIREALIASTNGDKWAEWSHRVGKSFSSDRFIFGLVRMPEMLVVKTYYANPSNFDGNISAQICRLHKLMLPKISNSFRHKGLKLVSMGLGIDGAVWISQTSGKQFSIGSVNIGKRYCAFMLAERDRPLADDLRKMERLLPIIQNVLQIALLHGEEREQAVCSATSLQSSRILVPVGRNRQIFAPGEIIKTLIDHYPELYLNNNRIFANNTKNEKLLEHLIEVATHPVDPVSLAHLFYSATKGKRFIMAAHPIRQTRQYVIPHEATAHLAIADPTRLTMRPSDSLLINAFHLTKREGEVVALLATGATIADIANCTGISSQTAAVHVRNIFRKTGVHRQTELAILFNSL